MFSGVARFAMTSLTISSEPSRSTKPRSIAQKGMKTLLSMSNNWQTMGPAPDLAGYFMETNISHDEAQQIVVCRAYASYLASLRPKATKTPRKVSKK